MSATKIAMLIAALLAGLYGFGPRKSAVEASEIATIPSPASNRAKGSGG